jgi:hypothetical protein
MTTATFYNVLPFTVGEGSSCILTLKLRETMFASSNIYWDTNNNRLTFAGYSDTPGTTYETEQRYQGVYFKWGSLVGISPVGTAASATVYVPTYNPSDTLNSTWDGTGTILSEFTDYEPGIPYARGAGGMLPPYYNNGYYVTEFSVDSFVLMKGDICRYLEHTGTAPAPHRAGLHWYLPMHYEFGDHSGVWNDLIGWYRDFGFWLPRTSDKSDGTYAINEGAKFRHTGNLFPASGARQANGALSGGAGQYSRYWSSTLINWTYAANMSFSAESLTPGSSLRVSGDPVRCVLR